MLSLIRCQTPHGMMTAARMDAGDCLLPGAPDPVDLLREAGPGPGALSALLERHWPGWSGSSSPAVQAVLPLTVTEVWAAGVTYERSRSARMGESHTPDIYDKVYVAERPELFFKDNGRRSVGPEEPIGVRGDSTWSVPEPELAVVMDADGRILGYTIGNDVSSRDIEGQNPLYLPQAKLFTASCALGPGIVPAADVDPYNLDITCRILRGETVVWEAETSTSKLKRTMPELVGYLLRYNPIPNGTVLLTGTGLVPPDDVSLKDGDVVEIAIAGLGMLRNPARLLS